VLNTHRSNNKMVCFTSTVLSALLAQIVAGQSLRAVDNETKKSRKLSFDRIAGYEPNSKVTDHNAIDRDQKFMEIELEKNTQSGFDRARRIYQEGGNSKSYADITVLNNLLSPIGEKTLVEGISVGDYIVSGKLYKDAPANQRSIKVQYDTSEDQENWVKCRVGGLNEGRETDGCFKDSGTLSIGGVNHQYFYDSTSGNKNGRTLQGFSTAVEEKMLSCSPGCPMQDADYFTKYYGQADYADRYIQAAFDGGAITNFDNGNVDFNGLGFTAKSELIKKGTVCMNVFMYVIREFEDAINDCRTECDTATDCNDDPVHAWDEGVAFYAGSYEGSEGFSSGKMLHQLADKRCRNFKTCGLNGDLDGPTTSYVNHQLLKLFNRGKEQLLSGQCGAVRPTVREIANLMYIPLIQATLRYAYFLETGDRNEKQRAEGAVFSASVLPRIHAASRSAAATISSNMSITSTSTSFSAVKSAFESVYADLGITCRKVGGIVKADGSYIEGGAPCVGDDDTSDDDDKAMSMSDDDTTSTKGCTDDGTNDDDKTASDDDKAAADDGTDDDKAATDDGTGDDKAAADDGTDDDKAAADDDDGCNGVGSTAISTIVVILSMVCMSAIL